MNFWSGSVFSSGLRWIICSSGSRSNPGAEWACRKPSAIPKSNVANSMPRSSLLILHHVWRTEWLLIWKQAFDSIESRSNKSRRVAEVNHAVLMLVQLVRRHKSCCVQNNVLDAKHISREEIFIERECDVRSQIPYTSPVRPYIETLFKFIHEKIEY